AANRSVGKFAEQLAHWKPLKAAMCDPVAAAEVRAALPGGPEILEGQEGLCQLATLPEADLVLISIIGTGGLGPALAAIEAGKDIAVASKEILVMAGEAVMTA